MKLAFKKMGSGEPLIILHGLFGSSDNWQTLGKQFSEDFSVYLVDQRNHGRSPHSDEFDYDLLAQDLNEFMEEHAIPEATLIGHSMGGKTVMRFAQLFPEKVKKIVVADMGVKAYSPHHHEVLRAFHAIDPDTLDSRSDAEERIESIIPEFGVRQFLLKNLYRKKEGGYGLRVNFRVMESEMDRILEALPSDLTEVEALFIRGVKSNYIPDSDFDQIRSIFPKAEFADLQAGHWLHAEKPDEFYDEVKKFVTK
ncbi:MAG: alpha/beta fold hydrolase [Cryomorphaceae bacterium]